jgi:hypothetical protein
MRVSGNMSNMNHLLVGARLHRLLGDHVRRARGTVPRSSRRVGSRV